MRSLTIGIGPGFFAIVESSLVRQALSCYQTFQRREPIAIVIRAIIGLFRDLSQL